MERSPRLSETGRAIAGPGAIVAHTASGRAVAATACTMTGQSAH